MKVIIRIREHNEDLSNPKVLKTRELKKVINAFNDTDKFDAYRKPTGTINSLLVSHVKTSTVNEADIRFNIGFIDKETSGEELTKLSSVIADILKTIYDVFPITSNRVHMSVMPDIVTNEMRKYNDCDIKFNVNEAIFSNYTNINGNDDKMDFLLLVEKLEEIPRSLVAELKRIYSGETSAYEFAYHTTDDGMKHEYILGLNEDNDEYTINISSYGAAGLLVTGILTALCNNVTLWMNL